jgi:MFS family permease
VTAAGPRPPEARAFGMLALLGAAVLLAMGGWFAGSALAAGLMVEWELSASQAAWLTSAVQLGFVAGTLGAAVLNLPDLVPGRWMFAGAALLAAAANGLLLLASGLPAALASRFLVGLFLAGVYPPAMKMASTWFRQGRGFAIAVVVGALTVGKASPYLVEALGGLGAGAVVGSTSGGAVVAALMVAAGYRDGPWAVPARPFSWRLAGDVLRGREMRLATAGYLGHMWELYAFWAFVAGYWQASLAAAGRPAGPSAVAGLAFASIAVGVVGCLWGGRAADRIGREPVVIGAMAVSGTCAVLSAAVFGGPLILVLPVILAWGVSVIADSAQFSALVTEVAPPHAIGTALTLQVAAGFLLTMGTIQLMPPLVEGLGPRWAFPFLALGPLGGVLAIRRLRALRIRS